MCCLFFVQRANGKIKKCSATKKTQISFALLLLVLEEKFTVLIETNREQTLSMVFTGSG